MKSTSDQSAELQKNSPQANTSEGENTFLSNSVNVGSSGQESSEESASEESSSSYKSDTTWPDVEIPGTWGLYAVEENPWNDDAKPVVKFRNYDDLELTEEERNGLLTERIMACCSSYLDRSPEIQKYVLCKANLTRKNLQDISILTFHHYLQYLNLSYNQLTSLKPLGELPFLMYLDVAHNQLTEVLDFKPPFNLTYVNFSHNYVDVIDDLTSFWSLVHLDLSHNQIFYIKGLDKLRYLKYLNLSFNQIKELRNLNNMRLVHLNLQNNKIERIVIDECEGLHTLDNLVAINLSNNNIKSLKLFEKVNALQKIVMTGNKIKHLIELENLKGLRYLTEVDFRNNPFCSQRKYYELCIKLMAHLVILDGAYITSEEKVMVKCKYNPPPMVEAARKRANLLILEKLMKYDITETTLPISKPIPPIMVLVGPQGSGQRTILTQFAEKYQKYLKVGVSYTTRPKRDFEVEGVDYYFVSDDYFKQLMKEGEFLSVSEQMGYSYGFRHDELLKVYNEKLVLILHTDLISAIILRMKSLRPILILTLFYEEDSHYQKLLSSLCYKKWLTCFGKKIDILRLATVGVTSEDDQLDDYSSHSAKEMYDDVISYMPSAEPKSGSVALEGICSPVTTGTESTTPTSGGNIEAVTTTPPKKFTSVSFHSDKSEKAARSISEQEMGKEPPILSAVSEYVIMSDTDLQSCEEYDFSPQEEVEKFIASVVETRAQYVTFHEDNPGFFYETLFTDRSAEAILKLTAILKGVVQKKKEPFRLYSYEKDPCFEEMITERLDALYTDMYNEMCVSEDQQPRCWKENKVRDLQQ